MNPEEAYHHATDVCRLHETLYSKPFSLPAPPCPKQKMGSTPSSPVKSLAMWSDGMEPSSEAGSELGFEGEDLKVILPFWHSR